MSASLHMSQIRADLFSDKVRPSYFKLPRKWIRAVTFTLPLVFLSVVLLQPWAEPKWMFLDPLTAAQFSGDCCHVYYGFISNLGVMIWTSTAAVCLFAAILFGFLIKDRPSAWFALSAGVLTGWLALDDVFLLHEIVMPSFGIPQNGVIASYAVLALIYMLASWRIILSSDFWILFAGGVALVASIFIDTVFHSLAPALVYAEDSAKFFGIFCWGAFHITTMFERIARPLRSTFI